MSVGGYLTIYTLLFLVIFSRCFYFSRSFVFPSFIIHCRSSIVVLLFIVVFPVLLSLRWYSLPFVVLLSLRCDLLLLSVIFLLSYCCLLSCFCRSSIVMLLFIAAFSRSFIILLLFTAIYSVVLFILFYDYQELSFYFFYSY